jgi:signal transduction histidine kinase
VNFRFKLAAWFSLSFVLLVGALLFTAHRHLDEELRKDRWDRSHPEFPGWVIHGSYTDAEVHDILGELLQVWSWVGVPLVLCSLAVGYFIARRSLRPVSRINRELDLLHVGSVRRGIGLPEQDRELSALVGHVNQLLERVGRSYEEMADFSTRVAHELRTPLTILRLRLEAAAADLPADFSDEMQEEVHRLSRLVDRSLLAAKAEGGRVVPEVRRVDLSSVLAELHDDYALPASTTCTSLQWRVAPGLACTSDPEILRQILHNLLSNIVRHGQGLARVTAKPGGPSCVVVRMTNQTGTDGAGPAGVGIGLRLVSALSAALGEGVFRSRSFGRYYSARLVLPT